MLLSSLSNTNPATSIGVNKDRISGSWRSIEVKNWPKKIEDKHYLTEAIEWKFNIHKLLRQTANLIYAYNMPMLNVRKVHNYE